MSPQKGSAIQKSARSGKESLSPAPRPPTPPIPLGTREKQGDEEVQQEICIPLPPTRPELLLISGILPQFYLFLVQVDD